MKLEKLDVLFQQKKYKKLLTVSNKVKTISISDQNKLSFLKAECHRILKNYDKAIFEYKSNILKVKSKAELIRLNGLIAHCYLETQKPLLAIDVYKDILLLDGGEKTLRFRVFVSGLLFNLREYDEAESYAKKLLSYTEYYCEGLSILTKCAMKKHDKASAISFLSKFSAHINKVEPHYVFYIIHTYMRLNEFDLSASLILRAKSIHGSAKWFHVLAGMQAYEQKQYKEAILICRSIKIDELPDWIISKTFHIKALAQSLEKIGQYNESFKCYEFMANLNASLYKSHKIIDLIEEYKTIDFDKLPVVHNSYENINHIFMLGFPRSGTTLLETVLDTHPDIITMSEPPTISYLVNYMNNNFAQPYPHCLTSLDVEDIEKLRNLYYKQVEKFTGGTINKNCLIDKMPINTIHLPLINILFPEAKVILNIRHPLDVIYSCFQQQFAINNEMSFLITLKGCVERYKQVMNFFDEFSSMFTLNFITIKYENFIDNMDDEYEKLLTFLSLPVNDSFKNFAEHAKSKVVNTSSKNQVSKPLYKSSMYKWTNYQDILKPYFKDVERFVKKYGYTL